MFVHSLENYKWSWSLLFSLFIWLNLDHMIKVSAQTFSTTSRRKSEITIRVSDLFDNFHSFFRFYKNNHLSGRHRNKFCRNVNEFNCISQRWHSSLSYIRVIWFSGKGLKGTLMQIWKSANIFVLIWKWYMFKIPH